MRYYSDPYYKGWSATAIKEGHIYGCWGEDPDGIEYHECGYCGKVETGLEDWQDDGNGSWICDECKAEYERENSEDEQ